MRNDTHSCNWHCFNVVLVLLFIAKGIVYLCILPPFEGWDEYQHLAYMAYLDEHGSRPVLGASFVSRDLLMQTVDYPVPEPMYEQIEAVGVLPYSAFFSAERRPVYTGDHKDIRLYQAQHGDLYYRLAMPLFRASGWEGLPNTIYLLRLVNILFVAVSLGLVVWVLPRSMIETGHAAVASLLVVSQPLVLLNGCRVSNDALAIMLATVVVVCSLVPDLRRNCAVSLGVGIIIGLACWAKSTATILVPYWLCCQAVSLLNRETSARRALASFLVCLGAALVVLYPYLSFNLRHYGMLFVMQEALVNKGRTLADVLHGLVASPMIGDIILMWLKNGVWIGGWSFLKVDDISNISLSVTGAGVAAWICSLFFRARRDGVVRLEISVLLAILVTLTGLALGWHYLHSFLAWGHATTVVWYSCIGLPFFLVVVYDGLTYWSHRLGAVLAGVLLVTYLYADVRGSMAMLTFYSGGAAGSEALARIASLHPAWLGSPVLYASGFVFVVLWCAAAWLAATRFLGRSR